MTYETIRYAVADKIATITLDRPDKMNAFTARMMHEMIDAFDRVDADDDVRAVIVTGAGPRVLRRRRPRRGAKTFDYADARQPRGDEPTRRQHRLRPQAVRDGGGLLTLAHLQVPEAGDRRGQRPGGRRRRHHAAADGHPHRQRGRASSASSSRGAASSPRLLELVPAAHRRHLEGARVVLLGPRLRRRGGARRRPRQRGRARRQAHRDRARAIAREIADNTAPVSIALGKAHDPFSLMADPSQPNFKVPDLLPPAEIDRGTARAAAKAARHRRFDRQGFRSQREREADEREFPGRVPPDDEHARPARRSICRRSRRPCANATA